MHRTFIYGTLKTNEINSFHLADDSHGKAVFVGKGKTSKRHPLVMVTNKGHNNCPAVIDEEGLGHVSVKAYSYFSIALQSYES
ncbi:Gamma-glutamylaminecyclotransferase [Holothuria leucospilota]|uniref:Gamma-glutamylaminecyclotransferase n=1 Tax=Holothuria leucospilota TaxID=206669 RepID=A0A9Q1CRZ2_HOLLE|nr:Gamma-glutamylaminecyclotransferase [Holothuria leucospilota]